MVGYYFHFSQTFNFPYSVRIGELLCCQIRLCWPLCAFINYIYLFTYNNFNVVLGIGRRLAVVCHHVNAIKPTLQEDRCSARVCNVFPYIKQEAQLSPSDRAMRLISSFLAYCHATVQKLLTPTKGALTRHKTKNSHGRPVYKIWSL